MGDFTDRIPPSFDGRTSYPEYRNNVLFWTNLTSISPEKQGPALIGRLSGEAKVSATTVIIAQVCVEDEVEVLLRHLDRSYGVDKHNQLNADISSFMNYSW